MIVTSDSSIYQSILYGLHGIVGIVWYNGRKFDPGTPERSKYLSELRRDWIIWKHDSSWSYKLQNPEIDDQSMGQAQEIRKILKNKVISANYIQFPSIQPRLLSIPRASSFGHVKLDY